MINKKYARAYTEVLEILKYLPINEFCKIPTQKIEYYYNNRDCEYTYKYDFENPIYSKETATIIISLYKDYIVSNDKKEIVENILVLNQNK